MQSGNCAPVGRCRLWAPAFLDTPRLAFQARGNIEEALMAAIGFIGLGNMGGPMAANLLKVGHTVTGYDLNPEALRALTAAGGKAASSAAEAANGASVVITMLPAG